MSKIRYILKWFTSKVGHLTGISTGTRVFIDHWKSTWWIKLLTVFFVFIIIIALCVQFTRTPIIPATPANWLYSFLDDWSIVLSASAMGLLAIAAFLAILDNRHTRNLDRQERLLNEIIDWALEIQTSSLKPKITNAEYSIFPESSVLSTYGISFPKNEYIRSIASTTFEERLKPGVEIVIKNFTGFLFFKMLGSNVEPLDAVHAFEGSALNIAKDCNKEYAFGDKDINGW